MAKQTLTSPSAVLKKLMEDYGLNPSKLGAAISLNQATLRLLLMGKSKISCLVALRFSKFFGKTPEYWLNLQNKYDLDEAAKDKELTAILKNIKKAEKVPASKREAKGAAKKDDSKASKSGRVSADSKKTAKTATTKKSAADSKKTAKAAVTKRGAAKKMAADKSPAEPKPTGAKRGRKPKSATAAPAPEPDPAEFESESLFVSDPLFGSDPVFAQESESFPQEQEEETPVQETESFPPFSFQETNDAEEIE
jgi:addiction module HigA family antidote